MLRTVCAGLGLLVLIAGCSRIEQVTNYRRVMNDAQTRITMNAVCDISIGSAFREMTPTEREFAFTICGDQLTNGR